MPYDVDGIYHTSIFCKEELPTWEELYKEFWLGKIFAYDPDNLYHQEEDLYWKRPHRKLLLAWCCNQLNKLLNENIEMTKNMIQNHIKSPTGKFYFALIDTPTKREQIHQLTLSMKSGFPSIYTCKVPSTGEYSIFITNDHPRIDIDDLTGHIELALIIHDEYDGFISQDVMQVIELLLEGVIKYFENGIGWKDDSGKIVPYENITQCRGVGYDPAL